MNEDDMKQVALCLDQAYHHNMQVEVVTSALATMKDNPKQSISEAINYGLNEWVK
jgi:hypothetical protein